MNILAGIRYYQLGLGISLKVNGRRELGLMRPSIRDETGDLLWAVEPMHILQWAIAPWGAEEKAEIVEFVLVSGEDGISAAEANLTATGHEPFGLSSSDSRTFRSPTSDIASIICIGRDYTIAQTEHLTSCRSRFDTWYCRLKYTTNLRRVLVREANVALASSKLAAAHNDSVSSKNELWYREGEFRNGVERRYLKRLLLSRAFPAIVLITLVSMFRRDSFALTFSGMEKVDSHVRELKSVKSELDAANRAKPLKVPDDSNESPKIRDESGPPLCGVEPAKAMRWALATYSPEMLANLCEIIIVGGEAAMESTEVEIMTRGARPIHQKSPMSCNYAFPSGGAVMLMNIGRLRRSVDARLGMKRHGIIRTLHLRLRYSTKLKHDLVDEAKTAVAAAQLAAIQGTQELSTADAEAKLRSLQIECFGPWMRRLFLSSMIPRGLLLIILWPARRF